MVYLQQAAGTIPFDPHWHDSITPFHHSLKGLCWIEIWRVWRPLEYSRAGRWSTVVLKVAAAARLLQCSACCAFREATLPSLHISSSYSSYCFPSFRLSQRILLWRLNKAFSSTQLPRWIFPLFQTILHKGDGGAWKFWPIWHQQQGHLQRHLNPPSSSFWHWFELHQVVLTT